MDDKQLNIQQFQDEIAAYQVDPQILTAAKERQIGVIVGPAGSGKDTLRENLLVQFPEQYVRIVSDTTRPMRPGESQGVQYYFRSVDELIADVRRGAYLQVQVVHGRQISAMHASALGYDVQKIGLQIWVVDTEQQMCELGLNLKTVFLVPPSFGVLRERMTKGRDLSAEEITQRLNSALYECRSALNNPEYHLIVSESEQQTADDAHAFFTGSIMQSQDHERQVLTALIRELHLHSSRH